MQKHIDSLRSLPAVKGDDVDQLMKFSDALHSAIVMIDLAGYKTQLDGHLMLSIVVQQLPEKLSDKWVDYMTRVKRGQIRRGEDVTPLELVDLTNG